MPLTVVGERVDHLGWEVERVQVARPRPVRRVRTVDVEDARHAVRQRRRDDRLVVGALRERLLDDLDVVGRVELLDPALDGGHLGRVAGRVGPQRQRVAASRGGPVGRDVRWRRRRTR